MRIWSKGKFINFFFNFWQSVHCVYSINAICAAFTTREIPDVNHCYWTERNKIVGKKPRNFEKISLALVAFKSILKF